MSTRECLGFVTSCVGVVFLSVMAHQLGNQEIDVNAAIRPNACRATYVAAIIYAILAVYFFARILYAMKAHEPIEAGVELRRRNGDMEMPNEDRESLLGDDESMRTRSARARIFTADSLHSRSQNTPRNIPGIQYGLSRHRLSLQSPTAGASARVFDSNEFFNTPPTGPPLHLRSMLNSSRLHSLGALNSFIR